MVASLAMVFNVILKVDVALAPVILFVEKVFVFAGQSLIFRILAKNLHFKNLGTRRLPISRSTHFVFNPLRKMGKTLNRFKTHRSKIVQLLKIERPLSCRE